MNPTRIRVLDGWRGIAILLVLLDHSGIRANWIGQHGVALFFVLSGYLITAKLLSEMEQTGTIDVRHFYMRRFRRLMPAAWVYMIVAGWIFYNSPFAPPLYEWLAALFFSRNFQHPTNLVLGHFWSLSIEEQFYLIWPALLLFAGSKPAMRIGIAVAILIDGWRFAHWHQLSNLPLPYSQGTQYHADALLAGCVAAIALRGKTIKPLYLWALVLAFAGMTLPFKGLIPLAESAIIALMLHGAATTEWSLNRVIEWRPLVGLGRISYSVYLWQNILLITGGGISGFGSLIHRMTMLIVVACISYLLLEQRGWAHWRVGLSNSPQRSATSRSEASRASV